MEQTQNAMQVTAKIDQTFSMMHENGDIMKLEKYRKHNKDEITIIYKTCSSTYIRPWASITLCIINTNSENNENENKNNFNMYISFLFAIHNNRSKLVLSRVFTFHIKCTS